ncbi:amidohydrolase family protein, partial [Acetobacter orientalis]|uniref:amidohydrolase family protein n=1 Tax=Acetobacter orientalis TaxID=146474 RepID=UPI00248ED63B
MTTSSSSGFPWRFGPIRAKGCACSSPMCQRLHQRVSDDLSRRHFLGGVAAMLAPFALPGTAMAAAPASDQPLLLTNLRLFDGTGKSVRQGVQVLIQGKVIAALPSAGEKVEGAQVIDCQGKLVMPGLIDAHWHSILARPSMLTAMTADFNYVYTLAVAEADATLMRGFTTVRDMGGPAFGLKRAIDEGVIPGPRIYPSGAFLSQTSGHGDFRLLSELPRSAQGELSYAERVGVTAIADGADQVLLRAREQLMRGASQLKYVAGGGVMSTYDGLDVTEGSVQELAAAVTALLHGLDLGRISARQSQADPVDKHMVVIRQKLRSLDFTDDFVLTNEQGVTVRMDAAGRTTV